VISPESVERSDIDEAAPVAPPFRLITSDEATSDAGYCADGVCVVPEPDAGPPAQ